jgi:hypothetical protein
MIFCALGTYSMGKIQVGVILYTKFNFFYDPSLSRTFLQEAQIGSRPASYPTVSCSVGTRWDAKPHTKLVRIRGLIQRIIDTGIHTFHVVLFPVRAVRIMRHGYIANYRERIDLQRVDPSIYSISQSLITICSFSNRNRLYPS